MVLILEPAPNAPSYSNPDTFEPDTSNYLAWMKTIRDQLSGKALELYDFGLGVTVTPPTLENLDATNTPVGFYRFINGAGTAPANSNPYAAVRIERYDGDTLRQTWIGNFGDYFTRFCDNGVWGAWIHILPQRGSNTSGEWVRLADGTQICKRIVNIDLTASFVDFSYPATFLAGSGPSASWSVARSDLAIPGADGAAMREAYVISGGTSWRWVPGAGSTNTNFSAIALYAFGRYK